jgi:hypothetical protein
MSGTRRRVLIVGVLLLVCMIIAFAVAWRERPHASPKRSDLLLLTSLPIVFGEDFTVRQNGSPALKALESRYRVVPISTTARGELAKGRLLLMAQPLGQAPLDLVALDDWVRKGGRVMLLADPLLEWPSTRPLGDLLRPPPTFVDTGLLGHWGLRLDGPDRRGPRQLRLGGRVVETSSPGALFGSCSITADRFVARCRVGRGAAIVIADADFLDVDDLPQGAGQNLAALLAELDAL